MRDLEGRKRKGECYNYIIYLNDKIKIKHLEGRCMSILLCTSSGVKYLGYTHMHNQKSLIYKIHNLKNKT